MPLPLTVIPIPGPGAEDVLVAPDGRVWTGTADGAIHVHDPATRETTTVTATGGRPLGLENLPDGRILVCDAHRGLLARPQAFDRHLTICHFIRADRERKLDFHLVCKFELFLKFGWLRKDHHIQTCFS